MKGCLNSKLNFFVHLDVNYVLYFKWVSLIFKLLFLWVNEFLKLMLTNSKHWCLFGEISSSYTKCGLWLILPYGHCRGVAEILFTSMFCFLSLGDSGQTAVQWLSGPMPHWLWNQLCWGVFVWPAFYLKKTESLDLHLLKLFLHCDISILFWLSSNLESPQVT